jgi:hypothetical protein
LGAAMGANGIFSYGGIRHCDFGSVIWFWIGASVVSMVFGGDL